MYLPNMTWLDLYNYLYQQANTLKGIGNFNWQAPVTVYDVDNQHESICDTWTLRDKKGIDRLVLAINHDTIGSERD